MIIAKVILPLPIRQCFKYFVPDILVPIIGGRVIVPFRSRELIGIVIEFHTQIDTDPRRFKCIISIIDHKSIYNDVLLDILKWLSNYYYFPIGNIFFSILPKFLRMNHVIPKRYMYKWTITEKGLKTNLNEYKKIKRQFYILFLLKKHSIFDYELKKYDISKFYLNKLIKKKLCVIELSSEEYVNVEYIFLRKKNFFLNAKIIYVIEKILNRKSFLSCLCTRISTYTKVKFYLGIIQKTLEKGLQILILVPHVHYIKRIKALLNIYFYVSIDVIHSKSNDTQYLQKWLKIKYGEKNIIIGTNISIFLPFLKLGLIIIFEEHSRQYDCLSQLRYNVRDIGVLLAYKANIPVILDSDTPSLKTLYNIIFKKYSLIDIKKRSFPTHIQNKIIDFRNEKSQVGLSLSLINEIHRYIAQKKCILLIFHKYNFIFLGLLCSYCGWIAKCQNCQDYYEVNKYYHILFCKYCLIQIKKPILCDNCGLCSLIIFDFGIRKIKKKIQYIFPDVPLIFLLDKKNVHKKKLNTKFFKTYSNHAHIIIALDSMVKDYYFPHIHLIGLISIDVTFFSFNFQEIEYFAQFYIGLKKLMTNTMESIKILIQTSFPDNADLLELCNNGYFSLAKKILKNRKEFLLPPWSHQIIVYANGVTVQTTYNFLCLLYAVLNKKSKKDNVSIWLVGPHPCLNVRYKIGFFYQLLIQCSSRSYLHQLFKKSIITMNNFSIFKKVKWFLDINFC